MEAFLRIPRPKHFKTEEPFEYVYLANSKSCALSPIDYQCVWAIYMVKNNWKPVFLQSAWKGNDYSGRFAKTSTGNTILVQL